MPSSHVSYVVKVNRSSRTRRVQYTQCVSIETTVSRAIPAGLSRSATCRRRAPPGTSTWCAWSGERTSRSRGAGQRRNQSSRHKWQSPVQMRLVAATLRRPNKNPGGSSSEVPVSERRREVDIEALPATITTAGLPQPVRTSRSYSLLLSGLLVVRRTGPDRSDEITRRSGWAASR